MSTIMVDVDGTLIDYNDQPRQEVISAVKLMSGRHNIIIWSGGGTQYARMWMQRLFPDELWPHCAKFPMTEILPTDFIVDDEAETIRQNEYVEATVLSPEEFVMWALAQGATG